MALRPQRTFRRRQVESSDSDSDGAKEQSAEEPAESGRPSAGCRKEGAERPRGARSARGRGRVWASSRRSPGAASRGNAGAEHRTADLSTDEEEGTQPLTESKGDQSPSSDSSCSLEGKELPPIVKIPDAAFIQAARRKRELARTPGDYISLDVSYPCTTSESKRSNEEDTESDPDDHEKRILFTPKPQTLRQRMAEETSIKNEEASEESQEDENQDMWEQQQMRKAVRIAEGQNIDLSHSSKSQTLKKFDTSISFPPVNLEIIKKQLNNRLALLQDSHRSHQREYEKYVQDIKNSKTAIQNLESASDQAQSYKFYKGMKIYVENIIDCLNEKIVSIVELESSMYTLLLKRSEALLKRRQDELKCESSYLQQLSRKDETSASGSLALDEKDQRILEEIEARRMQRRQARALSGNCDHQEGMSSDDELSPTEMTNFHKRQAVARRVS
ncbi:GC-rich sequence DNA-binding factor 2 isoform X2 [Mastomys coucha]|uniref:GC-rich sequence DNA-binding factor 2 isoform X2 n=1 Tax=Mastomys coucha TaxID=35658 RepID=UPI00126285E7|nr:GC-rich sequence DNA-binding factor 2 isoform X2 [Mastomys coucha]